MANLRVKKTSRRIRKQVKGECISPTTPVTIKLVEQEEVNTNTSSSTSTIVSLGVKKSVENLPKPTFRLISSLNQEDQEQEESDDEVDEVVFERPENHYIRYIEPTDKELYERVEYDMDEQDQVYLSLLNKDRRKEGLSNITPYTFECVMDRLEKEWYNLVKDLPKEVPDHHHHNTTILPEDSACAICDDTEVENSNAIVFCDGCNVAVHQDCYGIPYIPEGQWLCRKCMISPENPVSCIFCPNEGGAFKQTVTNQWGHLLCAIWIPEVGVSNTIYMEPIDMIENIPKSRLKLCCYICKKKQGACIQCDSKYCFTAFHVTCARSVKLCMRMSNEAGLKAFCDRHTPKDYQEEILLIDQQKQQQKQQQRNKSKAATATRKRGKKGKGREDKSGEEEEEEEEKENTMTIAETKAARAHQHHYSTGIPIAPDEMLARLDNLSCLKTIRLKQRMQIVNEICHYWSLKRETRRGAPLIKRLHLEPWTANLSRIVDQRNKHSAMLNLRVDLEKIRMLAEQVKKREKLKLEISKKQHDYLETIYFPMDAILTTCLQQFIQLDKKQCLFTQVDDTNNESAISQKIKRHDYKSIDEFKQDMTHMWESVIEKNQPKTQEYRSAVKLKAAAPQLFEEAEQEWMQMKLVQDTTSLNIPVNDAIFDYDNQPLEFPMEDWDKMEEEQKAREEAEKKKKEQEEKEKADQEEKEKEEEEVEVEVEIEDEEQKAEREKQAARRAANDKRNARRREKRAAEKKAREEKALEEKKALEEEKASASNTTDVVEESSKSAKSTTIETVEEDNSKNVEKPTESVENNSNSIEGTTDVVEDNSKTVDTTTSTEIKQSDNKSIEVTTTETTPVIIVNAAATTTETTPAIIENATATITEATQDIDNSTENTATIEITQDIDNNTENTATIEITQDISKSADVTATETTQSISKTSESSTPETRQDNNTSTDKSITKTTEDSTNTNSNNNNNNNNKSSKASTKSATKATHQQFTSSSIPKKRSRNTPGPIKRSTRSEGLAASMSELMAKKGRMSKESTELYFSYIGASAEAREKPQYVEDKKKHAPPGWMYVRSEDEESDSIESDDMEVVQEKEGKEDDNRDKDDEEGDVDIDIDKDEDMKTTNKEKEEEEEGDVIVDHVGEEEKRDDADNEKEGGDEEINAMDDEELPTPKKRKFNPRKIDVPPKKSDDIKPGDIVWTRRKLHPYHPAKIVAVDDEAVPSFIRSTNNKKRVHFAVAQFFNMEDEESQWSWVKLEEVFDLGDPQADEMLLDDTFSRPWKFKDQRIEDVWEAYKTVCNLKGIDPVPPMLELQQKHPRRSKQINSLIQSTSSDE